MHAGFHVASQLSRLALAGVAQWTECQPVKQRVAGSIPSQVTCLGCRPGPSVGHTKGNNTLMFGVMAHC